MIPFIDANIWLYFASTESSFHLKIARFLGDYLKGPKRFASSWQVVYEFIRCATDERLFETPLAANTAFQWIHGVISNPRCQILTEGSFHGDALKYVMDQGNFTRGRFIHDCHIAALLYENGIRQIITADQDFNRFSFLEIVDPTL